MATIDAAMLLAEISSEAVFEFGFADPSDTESKP
jgi:hypothetical protein